MISGQYAQLSLHLYLAFSFRNRGRPLDFHSPKLKESARSYPGELHMAWYAYCIAEQKAFLNGTRARRPFPFPASLASPELRFLGTRAVILR